MPRIVGGLPGGGLPDEPRGFEALRREAINAISRQCVFEVIMPEQPDVRDKLGEFIRLMYQMDHDFGPRQESDVALSMFSRMYGGPLRLTMMRYVGEDVFLGGGLTVKSNTVVAINSSKQTLAYPESWFSSLLAAEGGYSMDDLTKVVMSPNAPHKFKPFEEIEAAREGRLGLGKGGAGFLFLAYADYNLRGGGLSQSMLARVLGDYIDEIKVPYVFTYGRLPNIAQDPELSEDFKRKRQVDIGGLNRYVSSVLSGSRRDWGLELHHKAGAHIICGLPNSVNDRECMNSGCLAIYDLRELREKQVV